MRCVCAVCNCHPAAFLRAATNNDLGLKIFGGDALADTMMVSLLQDMPEALKDLSVTTVNKGKNPFIKRFREAFPTVTYGSFAAQAYDATVAVLRAFAAARPPRDGPELAKELRKQKFEGEWGSRPWCKPWHNVQAVAAGCEAAAGDALMYSLVVSIAQQLLQGQSLGLVQSPSTVAGIQAMRECPNKTYSWFV